VTEVRKLSQEDFMVPLPAGFSACAYQTGERYGQLTLLVRPMTFETYRARIARRDPANQQVPGVGEDAVFHACGELSAYSEGHVLQLAVQYVDCSVLGRLTSLARSASRRLSNVGS
jgi:hypothetical protein